MGLVSVSNDHLSYLIDLGEISHIGQGGSTLSDRIKAHNYTGLKSGEIIGFSKGVDELFEAWIDSPSHKNVIAGQDWNLIGIASKNVDGTLVSVVSFSSGIIKSIEFKKVEGIIVVKGEYIQEPVFKSHNKLIDYTINKKESSFYLKTINNKIIQVYNINNKLTDRIELFF